MHTLIKVFYSISQYNNIVHRIIFKVIYAVAIAVQSIVA